MEERLQRLVQFSGLIDDVGGNEFPDGTVTLRYRYVHVLYQEAIYVTTAPSRRAAWSLEVASA